MLGLMSHMNFKKYKYKIIFKNIFKYEIYIIVRYQTKNAQVLISILI